MQRQTAQTADQTLMLLIGPRWADLIQARAQSELAHLVLAPILLASHTGNDGRVGGKSAQVVPDVLSDDATATDEWISATFSMLVLAGRPLWFVVSSNMEGPESSLVAFITKGSTRSARHSGGRTAFALPAEPPSFSSKSATCALEVSEKCSFVCPPKPPLSWHGRARALRAARSLSCTLSHDESGAVHPN